MMLLLNSQDIPCCQIAEINTFLNRFCPGISYQKPLFLSVTSFVKSHFKKAEEACHQFGGQEPLFSTIIKEKDLVTVWLEARDSNSLDKKIPKDLKPKKKKRNKRNLVSIKWLL